MTNIRKDKQISRQISPKDSCGKIKIYLNENTMSETYMEMSSSYKPSVHTLVQTQTCAHTLPSRHTGTCASILILHWLNQAKHKSYIRNHGHGHSHFSGSKEAQEAGAQAYRRTHLGNVWSEQSESPFRLTGASHTEQVEDRLRHSQLSQSGKLRHPWACAGGGGRLILCLLLLHLPFFSAGRNKHSGPTHGLQSQRSHKLILFTRIKQQRAMLQLSQVAH